MWGNSSPATHNLAGNMPSSCIYHTTWCISHIVNHDVFCNFCALGDWSSVQKISIFSLHFMLQPCWPVSGICHLKWKKWSVTSHLHPPSCVWMPTPSAKTISDCMFWISLIVTLMLPIFIEQHPFTGRTDAVTFTAHKENRNKHHLHELLLQWLDGMHNPKSGRLFLLTKPTCF